MKLNNIFIAAGGVAAIVLGWNMARWPGVALVVGGIIMWMLLHFTRMMKVLERASNRPVGYCDSAVMLNAKLKPGMALLHVVAMTKALGEQLSPKEEQPEVFRWSDAGASSVTCEFQDGKLVKWNLERPQENAGQAPGDETAPR